MSFIQIIEITTNQIDQVQQLIAAWAAETEGKRGTRRATLTQDRDRADTYLQIVEFPTRATAEANSNLAETSRFAKQLAELCAAPPLFRNLDVRHVFDLA